MSLRSHCNELPFLPFTITNRTSPTNGIQNRSQKGESPREDAETQRIRKGIFSLRSFAALRFCVKFFCRDLAITGLAFILILAHSPVNAQTRVLIVQDEMPQVEVLAGFLRDSGKLEVTIADQAALPDELSPFRAVLGFIHKKLERATELAIIDYTKSGGRFVCLHHTISSAKAKNEFFFDFLGIRLDNPQAAREPVEPGGHYGWRNDGGKGVTLTLVNLNPHHYITNHQVQWGEKITYTPSDHPSVEGMYPSLSLENSEVYLNHKFTDGREKTVLCGFKFFDDRNGRLFMQDRAVWLKKYGRGEIIYILPGDNPADYENKNIAQMILNAITWKS